MTAIQDRLKGLVVDPKREWAVIAGEPTDVGRLYREFIVIVAAIPSLAVLVRLTLGLRPLLALNTAVTGYLMALAQPIIGALIVEKLAPKFQASGSTVQALKLVAYSSAPVWAARAFFLVPGLGQLATLVAVLYAIYLFALGLTPVLNTPREQIVPFIVVCAIALLVVNIVLSLLLSRPAFSGWW